MESISLSLVLPATGPTERLAAVVAACQAVAVQRSADYELILVDDSNSVARSALVDRLAATSSAVAVLRYHRPGGYRRALVEAWAVARGSYIGILERAHPSGPPALARLLELVPAHDLVFAYREPPLRRPHVRLFNAAVRAWMAPGLRDPALAMGLFRADQRDLIARHGADALVQAEIYAAARARNLRIAQVGVPQQTAVGLRPALPFSLSASLLPVASLAEGEPSTRRRVVASSSILIAAGLWLLRRLRR